MSLYISYQHHYPCFDAFYDCHPYFIITSFKIIVHTVNGPLIIDYETYSPLSHNILYHLPGRNLVPAVSIIYMYLRLSGSHIYLDHVIVHALR